MKRRYSRFFTKHLPTSIFILVVSFSPPHRIRREVFSSFLEETYGFLPIPALVKPINNHSQNSKADNILQQLK